MGNGVVVDKENTFGVIVMFTPIEVVLIVVVAITVKRKWEIKTHNF